MPVERTSGVSSGVMYSRPSRTRGSKTHGQSRARQRRLGPKELAQGMQQDEQDFAAFIASLGPASNAALADMRGDHVAAGTHTTQLLSQDQEAAESMDWVDDMSYTHLPADQSGEEGFVHALRDLLKFGSLRGKKRRNDRSRRHRMQSRLDNWAPLIPSMVDAYLRWKYPRPTVSSPSPELPDGQSSAPSEAEHTTTEPADSGPASPPDTSRPVGTFNPPEPANTAHSDCDAVVPDLPKVAAEGDTVQGDIGGSKDHEESLESFEILVVDLTTLERSKVIDPPSGCKTGAEALVSQGYLGCSPLTPSFAFSLNTLDLFRRLRTFKASFSTEAFAKVVCDYYQIPYRRTYREMLGDTFDIYLEIIRAVDKRVKAALGRDGPDWRVLHACPPCTYKLQDEPELKISRMYVLDGNDSLKRLKPFGERQIADTRVFNDSDYFLSNDYVDRFAHEVKSRREKPDATEDDGETVPDSEDSAGACEEVAEGDPTDGNSGDPALAPCVKNWKAANADEKKRMWSIFDESGIFASACRHSMILWLVDMRRSGELAKYPLAIISKVLELMGSKTCGGYDIGCKFVETILNSSLGPRFLELENIFCVNAFHGYSHGYSCQRRFHPSVVEGMGLEDLETLERVFSASNQLAPVIRHASAYRRRVFIDLFFTQWDKEKYTNVANMLYDNYLQALDIIETDTPAVREALIAMGLTDGDLQQFETEETQYISTLGEESEADVFATTYVELLEEMNKIRASLERSTARFILSTPEDYEAGVLKRSQAYTAALTTAKKIESERRTLSTRLDRLTREVCDMEAAWGITRRWERTDTEYIEAMKYTSSREYHRALDDLQRLVVQRIFELQKLNVAQTGYRMRTHIAKSIRTRCQTIQKAIKRYNAAARQLVPPRPELDWDSVSNFSFISEFTLLKDTRSGIQDKRWSEPAVRNLMRQARRINNAHEEIVRCNVEVRRLHTHIIDENAFMASIVQQLGHEDPIYGAVHEYCTRRFAVNAHLLARIQQLHALPGYTGHKTTGIREGMQQQDNEAMPSGDVASAHRDLTEDDAVDLGELGDHDEEVLESINIITDYMAGPLE